MKKFILLSFGFLGWAFYVMSGGADFEPASVEQARLNPVSEETRQETAPVVLASAELAPATMLIKPQEPAADDVTRAAVDLNSLQDALETEDHAEGAVDIINDANPDDTAENFGVPITDPTLTESATTPAIIPSLIAPNDGGLVQSASLLPSNGQDVREVTGNRVNVRGGPGTSFSIVTSLGRGDSVEILQDNGDGWVKMRPLTGGPEGWMADFLLTAG